MSAGGSVVVIGAGIVGASVAYHLAARGVKDVVVLEREPMEVTGSSAKSAAGVRHQFAQEVNIRLSLYSIERLKRFTEEIGGHSGLNQVGYLLLVDDPATLEAYRRNVATQRAMGVPVELITPVEAARIVPGLAVDDLLGATFCPTDGYCDPHGVATGYLNRARELGVELRRETPAIGFELAPAGDRILGVRTPDGSIGCDVVVNAAGPWAGRVGALAGLEIPVLPYRRTIYLTEPFPAVRRDIPLTIDVGSGFYFRKEHDQVLFGLSNEAEPSSENQDVDWEWLPHVLEAGIARLPILADAGLATKNCWAGLYEITPDHMPVLGRHPALPNYVDASGFSGHGVMHSPGTGMVVAEEIVDGRARTIDIDPLRIGRFASAVVPELNVF
jgi:sarcosine oxidase subunit beta